MYKFIDFMEWIEQYDQMLQNAWCASQLQECTTEVQFMYKENL